jgi:hypothetical protein
MCTTKMYESKECKHRWLVIANPCGYGKGFSTCGVFNTIPYRTRTPKCYPVSKDDCPWHSLKGNYDFNSIRMIDNIKFHNRGIPVVGTSTQRHNMMICCIIQ